MEKKMVIIILGILVLAIVGVIVYGVYDSKNETGEEASIDATVKINQNNQTVEISTKNNKNMQHLITLKTNYGEIQFETYDADAPKTVNNFITLAQKGFYNNIIFHRIIDGFMMQGGDPFCSSAGVSGDKGMCGTGGPGYKFEDELNPATESYKAGYKKGVVAMANSGPDTNGSQFFIMLKDYPLPNNYTIFGKVVKGQEVVDAIGKVKTNENDRPLSPVTIESVLVSAQ